MSSERLRKAAQAAVDDYDSQTGMLRPVFNVASIDALRAALASPEPQGEPVAWMVLYHGKRLKVGVERDDVLNWMDKRPHMEAVPLYTAPPGTVPREVAERMAEAVVAAIQRGDTPADTRANLREALAAYREAACKP